MLEEKILAALEKLQTDISGPKTDVSGHKAGQDAMQADISGIKVRLDTEIERKINLLAEGQELMLEKLERLVHGEYILDRRSILSVSVDGQNRFRQTALNDVVISKSGISQTVDVEIFCDDILVNHYQGDGVVIATPTGSTAYSLSAGGPVLDAHIAGLVVTPICAHSLHSPSMVFSAGRRLRVSLSSPLGPHNALLSCDGRSPETISCQDTVDVALSDKYISLICFNEADQFEAIDKKLKGR